ncbi:MAG: murA2 [Herbinix sp.]|jgi:UDP-N-acetylglucosamine 1-carboxyvinyltransferase|nr:murA2 [Herbinix sp.]
MSNIEVVGGERLKGELKIQGSKNASLPLLAATILNKGTTVLKNCPKILDVFHMIKILEELGCTCEWEENTLYVDSSYIDTTTVSWDFVSKMRSSILFMGALLGRSHEVTIAYPGGCLIGERKIDFHLDAMKKMNVNVVLNDNEIKCQTCCIIGTDIILPKSSVGATQNIILAAVLSKGTTRIFNAAKEPEVIELCNFLMKAGARIHGMDTPMIEVEGVSRLHDVEYTLSPDRIVAGTYMTAVAAAYGNVILLDTPYRQLKSLIDVLRKTGCNIEAADDYLKISNDQRPRPIEQIRTQPYPDFPTDMQSQMMSVLSLAHGDSTIIEEIFESRFQNATELNKMGARIDINEMEKKAVIHGVEKLNGAEVKALDLRSGAALVVAGLAAEGKTVIRSAEVIRRGYENIGRDLSTLGAKIKNF